MSNSFRIVEELDQNNKPTGRFQVLDSSGAVVAGPFATAIEASEWIDDEEYEQKPPTTPGPR